MCMKCQQRTELITARDLAGKHYGETWSGKIDPYPEKVWYDVSKAKAVLAACPPIAPELLDTVSVKMLWETQVSKSVFVPEHLDHVDMEEPILLVTTHKVGPNDYITLIDGTHRVARAHRDGIAYLKAIKLGIGFSRSLLIPPERAVMDELLTELLATGAVVRTTGEGHTVITGGNPAPQTEDDHPLRAQMLAAIYGGPALFALPK